MHAATDSTGRVMKIVRNSQCLLEAHVRLDSGPLVIGSATVGKSPRSFDVRKPTVIDVRDTRKRLPSIQSSTS
jgi:hypothetical protein